MQRPSVEARRLMVTVYSRIAGQHNVGRHPVAVPLEIEPRHLDPRPCSTVLRGTPARQRRLPGRRFVGNMEAIVVVIEDDLDIAELLREVLESDGFAAMVFRLPDAAAITGACPRPQAFLIDLMLPGMNGVNLARALRTVYPQTPMMAMSASRLMLELASASGLFQDFVAKPFNLSTVLDSLDRFLGSRATAS